MAGEETKESLQTKVKAEIEQAIGPDASTFLNAMREHWKEGEYTKAAGDYLNGAATGISHALAHPIKTLQLDANIISDDIKAASTPSVETRGAAERYKSR